MQLDCRHSLRCRARRGRPESSDKEDAEDSALFPEDEEEDNASGAEDSQDEGSINVAATDW